MNSPDPKIDWKHLIIKEAVRVFDGPASDDEIGISAIMKAVQARHATIPGRKRKTGSLDRSFAYAYFGSIHVLKAHVAARSWAELAQALADAAFNSSSKSPQRADATLVALCVAYVAFAQKNPARFRLMFDPRIWTLPTGPEEPRASGEDRSEAQFREHSNPLRSANTSGPKLARDPSRFWQPRELSLGRWECWRAFDHASITFGRPDLTQFFASYAQGRAHEAVHEGAGHSPEQQATFRADTAKMLRAVLVALSRSLGQDR